MKISIANWLGCAALSILSGCERDPMPPVLKHPAEIQITPAVPVVRLGDTLRLLTSVFDSSGNPIRPVRVSWTTADSSVIRLDSTGLIFGRTVGSALVVARAENVHADISVLVQAPDSGWRSVALLCGVRHDLLAYCWPWPEHGGPMGVPEQVSDTQDFKVVRTGPAGHRCGISSDGRAFCWGLNLYGQLGDGTTVDRTQPTEVGGGLRFDSISLGALHTCALTPDRAAYCWGGGRMGQLGVGPAPESCAGMPCSRVPVSVAGNHRFRSITAGGDDRIGPGSTGSGLTCALDEMNNAYCWGMNFTGSVGDGTREQRDTPVPVVGGHEFAAIAAGAAHACGLTVNEARLYCWGMGADGQLGVEPPDSAQYHCFSADIRFPCTSIPLPVNTAERFGKVAAGGYNTCAIGTFGEAFCWGDNDYGQVGHGIAPNPNSADFVRVPARVAGGHTFLEIRPNIAATCGLASDGSAYCWGNGFPSPQRVPDPIR